jgi:hypothetical protein
MHCFGCAILLAGARQGIECLLLEWQLPERKWRARISRVAGVSRQ